MPENNGTGPTVIVVDDCADIRELLRVVLEARGYHVLEAEDGRAAVELAKHKCPDLILMDLDMPVLDGLAATRLLRELAGLCDVPVIAVSAHTRETHRADAFAAGCNEYLTKPVDFAWLDHLLNSLLTA
jgi:two-component system, cell cycle response regulator DivK